MGCSIWGCKESGTAEWLTTLCEEAWQKKCAVIREWRGGGARLLMGPGGESGNERKQDSSAQGQTSCLPWLCLWPSIFEYNLTMVSFRAKFCGDYVSWNTREKAGGIKSQDLSNLCPSIRRKCGESSWYTMVWEKKQKCCGTRRQHKERQPYLLPSFLSEARERDKSWSFSINNSHPEFHFQFGAFLVNKHPLDHSVDNITYFLSPDFVLDARDTTGYQGSHL